MGERRTVGVRQFAVAGLTPWYRTRARGAMRPGYLVVGTKRGGSSALAAWVTRHPQVAAGRAGKGTHYFDVNHGRGEAWFRSQFAPATGPFRITGEASPYYMFHPCAPGRIKTELPEARLIVVLREPVARAWSHFRRETDTGHEQLSFVDALAAEDARLAGEHERLLREPGYESYAHRHHSYRARGHYADQLQTLYALFPTHQVLVLQSEALFAAPNEQLDRVWSFLGVDPVHLDGLEAVKAGVFEGAPGQGELEALRRYYEPLNEQLYALPGVDFVWPAPVAS